MATGVHLEKAGGAVSAQPWVSGAANKVPCPSCGKANDFSHLESQRILDTGHVVSCDACGRSMEVTSVRQLTIVSVRQHGGIAVSGGTRRLPPARQATTLSPAATRRLLR